MDSVLFLGIVCLVIAALCAIGLVVEYFRGRRAPVRVTRHDQLDWREPTQNFIGGTGIPRARVAHYRIQNEGRTAATAGPLTTHMEDQPHAGTR